MAGSLEKVGEGMFILDLVPNQCDLNPGSQSQSPVLSKLCV